MKLRILVVENERAWNEALQALYWQQLGNHFQIEMDCAFRGDEAMQKLRRGRYNLLSLDINLGAIYSDISAEQDEADGASGQSILSYCSDKQRCDTVVVVSSMYHDSTLKNMLGSQDRAWQLPMEIMRTLRQSFANKHLMAPKPRECPLEITMAQFKANELSSEALRTMLNFQITPTVLRRRSGSTVLDAQYVIQGTQGTRAAQFSIPRSTNKNRREAAPDNRNAYNALMFMLETAWRLQKTARQNATFRATGLGGNPEIDCATFMMIRKAWDAARASGNPLMGAKPSSEPKSDAQVAHEAMTALKRYLESEVNVDALLENVRGKGWRLCENIRVVEENDGAARQRPTPKGSSSLRRRGSRAAPPPESLADPRPLPFEQDDEEQE